MEPGGASDWAGPALPRTCGRSITLRPIPAHIAEGRLTRALADWCRPFSGYHLHYPSRRQPAPAFAVLVATLRYR
jgi:DNA-binding transcriptional LysR family regulator